MANSTMANTQDYADFMKSFQISDIEAVLEGSLADG